MKKSELGFTVVQIPVDYVMTVLAALLAYWTRLRLVGSSLAGAGQVVFAFDKYLLMAAAWGGVWILAYALVKAYSMRRSRRPLDDLYNSFLGVTVGTVLLIIFIFLSKELILSSRLIVLTVWVYAIIMVLLGRLLLSRIQIFLYRKGIGINRIVLIGKDRVSGMLATAFAGEERRGYDVMKVFSSPTGELTISELADKIKGLHRGKKIDQIIVADPNVKKQDMVDLIDFADEEKIVFKYAADLFETQATNIDVRTIDGIPVVELKRTPLDGWGRITKRIFDIVISGISIVLLSPLYLLTAIAVKLDSRGPIFFNRDDKDKKTMRIGKGGEPFHYFKFRSMMDKVHRLRYDKNFQKKHNLKDLRGGTPMVKLDHDPRITRVGKFIRRFSIDELAELFLVFIGRMSLVGPRPHLPEEVAKYKKQHKKVLTIKPGITGMAQVSGRSDLDFDDEVKVDTYYIENWSLLLDMKILLKTPMAVLKPRKTL